jgi:hypothetical protein
MSSGHMLYYPLQSVNTNVQGSQIAGGNKAQFFNIQALRIVTGYVYLTIIKNGDFSAFIINSVAVYDSYTNLPLALGSGDVIVGMVIGNISGGEIYSYSAPPPGPKIQFYFSTKPTNTQNIFNPNFPVWNGGTQGNEITDVLEVGGGSIVDAGCNLVLKNRQVIDPYCWISCEITNPITMLALTPKTGNLAVLGITFLIMNSNNAQ